MDEEATRYRGTNMPMAFVLINTEMGSENEILDSLLKIVNVKMAYVVYGVYDVIALVEAETMDQLKDIITWKIRRLSKVRSTLTTMVVQENKTK
jgi:DNA-binding Lrp family transcriptional regulator